MRSLDEIVASLDGCLGSDGCGEKSGLRVSGRPEVRKVAGAVDLSFAAIAQAAGLGCDLLFTHHDAWASTDADLAVRKYEHVRDLGVSLYVSHDPLDVHPTLGTAISLANCLGWQAESVFEDGLGVLARPREPETLPALAKSATAFLGADVRIFSAAGPVDLVAIIAGWGARPEWMSEARRLGATTFLSGEAIHFGVLYARESHTNLLLGGHYATELPGVRSVLCWIREELAVETTTIIEEHEVIQS